MTAPVASACRNCGAATGGRFCPECGQETAPHPPTAGEFLHEFIGHYIALEGALWLTLRTLLRPGVLTLEYFAGRKRRYVLPLRLYLTVSLVFFLVSKMVAPPGTPPVIIDQPPVPGEAPFTLFCAAESKPCAKVQARIRAVHPGETHAQVMSGIRGHILQNVPYAMFFLVPLFAAITRLAYRRRPFNYGEHVVFALHVHAFAFLAGIMLAPVPLRGLMTLATAIYVAFAARRVFGGRTWTLVLRFLFVAGSYLLLVMATMAALGAASLLL